MMHINMELLDWSLIILIKKTSNKELAEELHKPIISKFKKRKVHLSFMDNIWGTDIPDRQLLSKSKKGLCF